MHHVQMHVMCKCNARERAPHTHTCVCMHACMHACTSLEPAKGRGRKNDSSRLKYKLAGPFLLHCLFHVRAVSTYAVEEEYCRIMNRP